MEKLTYEIWRDIPEEITEWDMYQISNFWRVRNVTYYKKRTKILKPECGPRTMWYEVVKLKKNNKFVKMKVHRLVARAFLWLNYFDPSKFVCHKDDVRNHNNASNLFIGSYKDNSMDAWSKGRWKMPNSKLKIPDIKKIKKSISEWEMLSKIAERFKVSLWTISYIKSGKIRWYIS